MDQWKTSQPITASSPLMGDHNWDAAVQAALAALSRRYEHLSWIAWSNFLVHVKNNLPPDRYMYTLALTLEYEIMFATRII